MTAPRTQTRVAAGELEGASEAGVRIFRGIRYAAPPVGPMRWRPPGPVQPWLGTRPATTFGPRCIQTDRHTDSISSFGPEQQSEDCLFLNIWTVAETTSDRLPVLVWLHGGALEVGSGALPMFDGTHLARNGLVVVTVNYRLGRLGYLAHPALSAEGPTRSSGNYGLMDQIAALCWVRENIRAFGGDPDAVTLAGQSAGAMSASVLMAVPSAAGLFHRVALHSGATFGPVGETARTGDAMQQLDAAERSGARFATAFGARSVDELREIPPLPLQIAAVDGSIMPAPTPRPPGQFDTSWLIVDGELLPSGVASVFNAGRQAAVPMLSGSTAEDWSVMPPLWAAATGGVEVNARTELGENYDEFARLFPHESQLSADRAARQVVGFRNFIWQNFAAARAHSAIGYQAWHYRFEQVPPLPPGQVFAENVAEELGAYHTSDLYYLFGTMSTRPWKWTDGDRTISDLMTRYWVRFASSGDPNGGADARWPQFADSAPLTMRLGAGWNAEPTPDLDRIRLWDTYFDA